MITFRYHVVTLVAVFLALAVGVLFGATFIDQNIVEGLEATQQRLGDRNEQLRNRIVALEQENEQFRTFTAATRDASVRNSLADQPVVVLRFDATPDQMVESVTGTLVAAGARLDGVLGLTAALDLTSEETQARLATVMDFPSEDPEALSVELARQLAEALIGVNPQVVPRLAEAGLVRGELALPEAPLDGGQAPVPPAVVMLAGQVSPVFNDRLVMPLARALSEAPQVVAVGTPGTGGAILEGLRGDSELRVVTVDGVESAMGQTALALGLRAALGGQFGMYGTGEGATTALPIPPI